jgi:hypothetical protein
MKKGLIVGIMLMILSGIVCVVCLMLPSMTKGGASFEECMMVFIPSAILFAVAALLTIVSAVRSAKAKNTLVE